MSENLISFSSAMVGKPMYWETQHYGKVAVHLVGFSPNNKVANITIDGGPDATVCQRFGELADGTYFATPETLSFKPSTGKTRARATRKDAVEGGGSSVRSALRTPRGAPRKLPNNSLKGLSDNDPRLMSERRRDASAERALAQAAGIIKSDEMRQEMGYETEFVADMNKEPMFHAVEAGYAAEKEKRTRRPRRLGLTAALMEARKMVKPGINWPAPTETTF